MRAAAVGVTAVVLCGFAASAAGAAAPLTVSSSVDRARVHVGQPFVLEVDVRAGTDVRPGSIVAEIDPGPFATLDSPHTTTAARDGAVFVRTTQTLACLDVGCVPGNAPKAIPLPRARAVARLQGGGRVTAVGAPVIVTVIPRVSASAANATTPPYRRQTAIPPPSFRVSPGVLGAALLAASVLLALAAALLLAVERRRRDAARAFASVDELDRAVRLAREAVTRDADDKRRAIGLLARVLSRRSAVAPAARATELAWNRPSPSADATESAADEAASLAEAGT